jgi:hypothetical protein
MRSRWQVSGVLCRVWMSREAFERARRVLDLYRFRSRVNRCFVGQELRESDCFGIVVISIWNVLYVAVRFSGWHDIKIGGDDAIGPLNGANIADVDRDNSIGRFAKPFAAMFCSCADRDAARILW